MLTSALLTEDFTRLGVCLGDTVIFHSSYKSLGQPCEDGARSVINALQAAVGPQGTLLLPCFTDPGNTVDVLHTPCRLGYIPETFRTLPGVAVSNNHTHRVAAWGRHAQRLVSAHEGRSPLGRGSPFHEAAKLGGKVLMLGCTYTACSLIHVAEDMARLPFAPAQICYPGYDQAIAMTTSQGRIVTCPPVDSPGDSAAFAAVEEALAGCGDCLARGRVAAAPCTLARGTDVLCAALDLLAGDPLALLCKAEGCPVCQKKRRFALLLKVRNFVVKKKGWGGGGGGGGGGETN